MELTAAAILAICAVIGFVLIFFSSVGTLLIMAGAAAYAAITNFTVIDVKTLIILFTLYLASEVLEYIFIIVIAKKLGASNWAVLGAIAGGILGGMFGASFFGVGIALGVIMGIFLGAFLVELLLHKDLKQSLKAGLGGVFGRLLSIAVKVAVAVIMLAIIGIKTKILPLHF